MAKKSLAETHPELAKEWHHERNGELTPHNVTYGSKRKVWWKCEKGEDHIYLSRIADRSRGDKCSICRGLKVVESNCLATTHPEIAKQWHPTKNGDLKPSDVSYGISKKVWWKCDKGDDHEWLSSLNNRSRGKGCPICSGHKVSFSNSLASTHPELAKEWHPTKNGDLMPSDVSYGSNKKVWWKCKKGEDHIYLSQIANRSHGDKCPICRGLKVVESNCLATTHPKLVKEWHPTRNSPLTPHNVTYGSTRKVWWKCDKGDDHEWSASIVNRSKGNGCAICSGYKIVLSNCLLTTHPKLAKQWHPTKNGDFTPIDFTQGSNKKVWWKCPKGDDHEWITSIAHRSNGKDCPVCRGLKVVESNCLATTHPDLAREWHPTKNKNKTPYDITKGHQKKIWWICASDPEHVWSARPGSRTRGHGCPYCTLTPQSKQELILTFELRKFFRGIDPKGYKTFLEGKLRSIDIYISKLNLCIEFDGSYWHKDKRELDKIKSEMILKEGFKLIRVREEPLKKIYDTDVISTKPYDGKQVTNDILSVILEKYDLDDTKVSKIKDYQQREELQNEKALDRYIDKILTEKAEKKDNSRASA